MAENKGFEPWMPVRFHRLDHPGLSAIKSLANGNATPEQQLIALKFIVERLAGADDLSFRPDKFGGERDTAFAEGRRFIGLQIRKIAALPMPLLIGEESKHDGRS